MKEAEEVEERAVRLSGMVNIICMEALLLLELAEDMGQEVFVCARAAARSVCNRDLDWPTANARVVPLAAKTTRREKIRAMTMTRGGHLWRRGGEVEEEGVCDRGKGADGGLLPV